jgi:hypothetical protein
MSVTPNPFNASVTLSFELVRPSKVNLKIFDLMGREVTTLMHENHDAGVIELRWQPANIAGGLYFARLQLENESRVEKLLYLK